MNGFAKMKSNEIPTAIIAIASKRPATINILVCRLDANSGWRADDSKNLPPKIAKPIAVPNAANARRIDAPMIVAVITVSIMFSNR